MKFKKMIFVLEIIVFVVVFTIVLLSFLEPLLGFIIIIVIQIIIGNVVLPIYYSKNSNEYIVRLETYSSRFKTEIDISRILKDNSKKIFAMVFTFTALLLVVSYGLLLIMLIIIWVLNINFGFDNLLLLIILFVIGPLYAFLMYKFISFPLYPDENGLNGYFRLSLDHNERLFKGRVNYKAIENVTLIENKLIDSKKHVAFIEFELNDKTKMYLSLLAYKVKDRKHIIGLLKMILID